MSPAIHAHQSSLVSAVAAAAHILTGSTEDYDPLMDLIGDARFVLLGEASHGTHEFYQQRARITQRLIVEKNFTAVAVEADWPDAYRVNRYVRKLGSDVNSDQALAGFKRFPTWMWRNTDVQKFVEWLRSYNDTLQPLTPKTGFYGLDLYSMFTSIEEVLHYLNKVDPEAAQRARELYACFDHFDKDSQHYGYAAGLGISPTCENAVVAQCRDLHLHAAEYIQHDGPEAEDTYFYARQNARLVMNAEKYYRSMYSGRIASWNLRDQHMAETLQALAQHLSLINNQPAKIVVWEHNSHIGDARATEIGQQGEWNVGQLARELYGEQAVLIGFTTHHGTVTAASEWDGPAQRKIVRPALPGSYEELFHETGIARFMLPLRGKNAMTQALLEPQLERAIGVIYLPQTERQSHYFFSRLSQQFDAILHFDKTCAVTPLERGGPWKTGEAPETFPVGI